MVSLKATVYDCVDGQLKILPKEKEGSPFSVCHTLLKALVGSWMSTTLFTMAKSQVD